MAGTITNTLVNGVMRTVLVGGESAETLDAGLGFDGYVYGLGGNDVLVSYNGLFYANLGTPFAVLSGGQGADKFVLMPDPNFTSNGVTGKSVGGQVYEFQTQDRIYFPTISASEVGSLGFYVYRPEDTVLTVDLGYGTVVVYGTKEALDQFNPNQHIVLGIDPRTGAADTAATSFAIRTDTQTAYTTADIVTTATADGQRVYGGSGNDSFNGQGEVHDFIFGSYGNDALLGGAGNDTIYGAQGDDALDDGAGDDIVHAGKGNDFIDVQSGNDLVFGNMGDDRILVYDGNDTIRGGQGNDVITAMNRTGSGMLHLYGDKGNDYLGDAPENHFVTRFYFHTDHGADIVSNFQAGVDKIVFTRDVFATKEAAFAAYSGDTLSHGSGTIQFSTAIGNLTAADFEII